MYNSPHPSEIVSQNSLAAISNNIITPGKVQENSLFVSLVNDNNRIQNQKDGLGVWFNGLDYTLIVGVTPSRIIKLHPELEKRMLGYLTYKEAVARDEFTIYNYLCSHTRNLQNFQQFYDVFPDSIIPDLTHGMAVPYKRILQPWWKYNNPEQKQKEFEEYAEPVFMKYTALKYFT